MDNKNAKNKWNAPIICFIVFFVVLCVLFFQFCYLSLSNKVYGIDMKKFASNRNTVTSTLTARRGSIYDSQGNTLAQNIVSYTLIAYLDEARTINKDDPKHVVDKDYTATKLSKILGESNYEYILERLNKDSKQVEFGKIGKNLTELKKLAIEELNLPGISFIETEKRYYPNGNFASYIVGYAKQYTKINIKINEEYDLKKYYNNFFKNYEDINIEISSPDIISIDTTTVKANKIGNSLIFIKSRNDLLETAFINVTDYDNEEVIDTTIIGELGIESKFENKLQGIDGYIKYQQDKYGYQIPNTKEEKKDSINGTDIYLTIDSNIQRFAEAAISKLDIYEPEWAIMSVMDAETGAILASSTSPSFNPNSLNSDMSYQNPLVSYEYEPGSVMKIYTYMCAIETGLYDGTKEYLSGSYEFSDGTIMHDWDKKGWGTLTYDSGFKYSSNTAIINIIKDYLNKEKLHSCLEKYGFGKKTGIELSKETSGSIDFNYEIDLMAAGYGQGISTTAIQQLQALSIIANNGVMVKPYIIKKMVDTNTLEEEITKTKTSEKLVSDDTIKKIKELMASVISEDSPTASKYYMEGYDIIGKTGTAQIYENGAYLTGSNDYIVSVALMYPYDDPKRIIYSAIKKPKRSYNTVLIEPVKDLVENISKYKSIYSKKEEKNTTIYEVDTYINKNINEVSKALSDKNIDVIIIGDGSVIIDQYPKKNTKILSGDKVFLVTNGSKYKIIDFTSWSRSDIQRYCGFVNLDCSFKGNGYAVKQSINAGAYIKNDSKLEIILENKEM